MRVLCTRVPEWLHEQLHAIARNQGIRVSDLVRDILIQAIQERTMNQLEELTKRLEALEAEVASLRSRVTRLEELIVTTRGVAGYDEQQ